VEASRPLFFVVANEHRAVLTKDMLGCASTSWRAALLFTATVLLLSFATCTAIGAGEGEQPKKSKSPFLDLMPENPPFKPMPKPPPFNIFEIPEFPSRFQSGMIHRDPTGKKTIGR